MHTYLFTCIRTINKVANFIILFMTYQHIGHKGEHECRHDHAQIIKCICDISITKTLHILTIEPNQQDGMNQVSGIS